MQVTEYLRRRGISDEEDMYGLNSTFGAEEMVDEAELVLLLIAAVLALLTSRRLQRLTIGLSGCVEEMESQDPVSDEYEMRGQVELLLSALHPDEFLSSSSDVD